MVLGTIWRRSYPKPHALNVQIFVVWGCRIGSNHILAMHTMSVTHGCVSGHTGNATRMAHVNQARHVPKHVMCPSRSCDICCPPPAYAIRRTCGGAHNALTVKRAHTTTWCWAPTGVDRIPVIAGAMCASRTDSRCRSTSKDLA